MKTYLGDGLYAEDDGYQVRLFTQEGNEVFLDGSVLEALLKFIEKSRHVEIKVTTQ